MKWPLTIMTSLQIFYWTHLLYIFYWILLILHAPNFWKWFVVPAILFVIEKFFRFSKSVSQEGKTWVTMGVVLPSKVVSLVIRRPPHFAFKPGKSFYQYHYWSFWKIQTLVTWTVTQLTGKALDLIYVLKVFQRQHELCLHN